MNKWILDVENGLIHEDDARHTIVCDFPASMSNPEALKDARLIASAPELYEALEELAEIVDDAIAQKSAKDLDSFTLQPARAALAKARGEA